MIGRVPGFQLVLGSDLDGVVNGIADLLRLQCVVAGEIAREVQVRLASPASER